MAYLVLARKYRPQSFGDMSGQAHVVRTLRNALKSGQLAHAFLFTGPRGVGKTTSARLVAKALNCEKGPTAEPCGICTPCVEIAEGRAVDVVEIDAASNNGVDNVRDIVEAVKYRPARDRYKVFVVDEVHMLSTGAFNALLKTLEEPPDHVKFVLATTDVHKVPETILSRCQRFDFKRLTVQQIADQLGKVAAAEGMTFSAAALGLIARAAEGGMRDALSMLDQVRAACGDAPDDAAVAEALGTVDTAAISRIAGALVGRDGATVLAELERLHARGLEMKRVAEELVRHLRNVVVAKLVPATALDLPDAELEEVRAQAGGADAAQLTRLFDLAQRSVVEVKLAEQPRYALEVALLKAVFLAPGADVAELLARVEAIAGGGGGAPAPRPRTAAPAGTPASSAAPAAAPAPSGAPAKKDMAPGFRDIPAFGTPGCAGTASAVPSPSPSPSPGPSGVSDPPPTSPTKDDPSRPVAERWRTAVESMETESPTLAGALKQAALLWLRDGEIAIQIPEGMYAKTAERRRGEIEASFAKIFGKPTRLAVTVGGTPPPSAIGPGAAPAEAAVPATLAATEAAERQARTAQVKDAARNHPNIREAARLLDGDVKHIDEL
jgi:DNA polymerase III subunit gamma/tau